MLSAHWGDYKCYQPCHSRIDMLLCLTVLFVEQNKLMMMT